MGTKNSSLKKRLPFSIWIPDFSGKEQDNEKILLPHADGDPDTANYSIKQHTILSLKTNTCCVWIPTSAGKKDRSIKKVLIFIRTFFIYY
jgi:hypothetical protein